MKCSRRQSLDFFFIELYSGSEVWADEMRRRGLRLGDACQPRLVGLGLAFAGHAALKKA